jgi:GNAT superfamily N-acetyltransferase
VTETNTARTRVVRVTEEHVGLLAEFFRAVWDPEAEPEAVLQARREDARTNPAARGVPSPTFIVVAGGRAVGFVTTIPGRVWANGREWQGFWLKGLMVLPEFRNGPVGFLLLKEAVRQLEGVLFGMVVAPAARKLFQALGFADVGVVRQRLAPLDGSTIAHRLDLEALGIRGLPGWFPRVLSAARRTGLDRLSGWAAGATRRLWAGVGSLESRGLSLATERAGWEIPEGDQLWATMRQEIDAGAVRDGAYLRWRYQGPDYELVTVRRGGRLVAIAAVKRPREEPDSRLRGIRVATLSDLVYDPNDQAAGLGGLVAAERAARAMGAHALLGGATAEAVHRLMARRAYLPVPANLHFVLRGPADSGLPTTLDRWWVTRGDGESDGF